MRLIGAIQPGEVPSASEGQDALMTLNGMVGQWQTQRLTIFVEERQLFPLTSGQQAYTIGVGGDFNHARPLFLSRASIISNNNPDQPLELPMNLFSTQQWQQQIPTKNIDSALPTTIYYDYSWNAGLGRIYVWPIPNVTNVQICLYLPTAITEFAELAADYTYPPGYWDALVYNLAVRLCPEYGRKLPESVGALAVETLGNIKRANLRIDEMAVDGALLKRTSGMYNYLSDGWGPVGS